MMGIDASKVEMKFNNGWAKEYPAIAEKKNATRFQVWMINFGYYLDPLFKSPEEAEAAGKATGFEFKVEVMVR
jgi:hypothetical protein